MQVLQSELLVTTYTDLMALCCSWAREPKVTALEFANTQVVTMRRHTPEFAELLTAFDAIAPDGMPLVWCLNAAGAQMRDRVYGPTFMRTVLEAGPVGFTHYLLGGSEETGRALRERFPGAKVVGSFHGKANDDGTLVGSAEHEVIDEINRLSPDFIWVGLGTPRQQAWIHAHKSKLKRGVLLSVGFAFDVNAGMKSDAPAWMQQRGLTWLYRMATEPRRLAPRYLKWNSLFLYYLARDGLKGQAFGSGTPGSR